MKYYIKIIEKLQIMGRGTVLVVKRDNYHINDVINDTYLITGIESSQYSPIVGLIVRKINGELSN